MQLSCFKVVEVNVRHAASSILSPMSIAKGGVVKRHPVLIKHEDHR